MAPPPGSPTDAWRSELCQAASNSDCRTLTGTIRPLSQHFCHQRPFGSGEDWDAGAPVEVEAAVGDHACPGQRRRRFADVRLRNRMLGQAFSETKTSDHHRRRCIFKGLELPKDTTELYLGVTPPAAASWPPAASRRPRRAPWQPPAATGPTP